MKKNINPITSLIKKVSLCPGIRGLISVIEVPGFLNYKVRRQSVMLKNILFIGFLIANSWSCVYVTKHGKVGNSPDVKESEVDKLLDDPEKKAEIKKRQRAGLHWATEDIKDHDKEGVKHMTPYSSRPSW